MAGHGDPARHMHEGLFRSPPTLNKPQSPDLQNSSRSGRAFPPGRQYNAPSTSPSNSDRSATSASSASYVTAQSTGQAAGRGDSSPSSIDTSAAGTALPSRRSLSADSTSLDFFSARPSLFPDATPGTPNRDPQQVRRILDPSTFDAVVAIFNGQENLVALETTVNSADARHWIAWESYQGDSLQSYIGVNQRRLTRASSNTPGLPEPLVWHVLVSLLKAITYLHTGKRHHDDQGEHTDWLPIVHDSIDPSNIFLTGDTNDQTDTHCRLGGFFKCVVLPSSEEASTNAGHTGTVADFPIIAIEDETGFEAPELVDDIGYPLGPASDIWSIGAVAILMMTGSHPWDFLRETAFHAHIRRRGATGILKESWRNLPHQRRWRILSGMDKKAEIMAALPRKYSQSLRAFVEGLLFIDPLDRGTADDILQDAIERSSA